MWQTAFLLPDTHRFIAPAKTKETARDSVLLVSSLRLFLATALLLSMHQTSGVEGGGYCPLSLQKKFKTKALCECCANCVAVKNVSKSFAPILNISALCIFCHIVFMDVLIVHVVQHQKEMPKR